MLVTNIVNTISAAGSVTCTVLSKEIVLIIIIIEKKEKKERER